MGEEPGKGGGIEGTLKSRNGFGYRVGRARAGPYTTVRDLLADEGFTDAVLGNTRVGMVKEGVLDR